MTPTQATIATAGGANRPRLRLSPHFYTTMDEIDRSVRAITHDMRTGV